MPTSQNDLNYTFFESGLERWINFKKEDFIGKDALVKEKNNKIRKGFFSLILENPLDNEPFGEAVYLSPVYVGEKYAGPVLSSGYGHRTQNSIAMAVLDTDVLKDFNKDISIEVVGRKRKAQLIFEPLYDPKNNKLKM